MNKGQVCIFGFGIYVGIHTTNASLKQSRHSSMHTILRQCFFKYFQNSNLFLLEELSLICIKLNWFVVNSKFSNFDDFQNM